MVKTVRDVMVPAPWTIEASTSLQKTARLMRAWDVGEVLVTDHGRLCGILTVRAISVLAIGSGRPPSELTAGECADPEGHSLDADTPVHEALDYMRDNGLGRVAIVEGDRLLGTTWVDDLALAAERRTSQITAV